jgi:hypothetical protein
VLMDAGYGCNTELRSSISALGLTYVAGILPNTNDGWPRTCGCSSDFERRCFAVGCSRRQP